MPEKEKAIEVEVVEIDGVTPSPPVADSSHPQGRTSGGDWQDWRRWHGRVRTLDARWWPLWIILGLIALSLLLTVGVVFAIVFLFFRIVLRLLLGIASLFAPRAGGGAIRPR